MYFESFPTVPYQFPDGEIRYIKNISLRPAIVQEFINDATNLQEYIIQDHETPESIAYDVYGDAKLHWIIILANKITNIYKQWPKPQQQLDLYLYEKYKEQEGYTLTQSQVVELLNFEGLPENQYQSNITVDSDVFINIRPHHFEDDDGNEYPYYFATSSNTTDAHGRVLVSPTVAPVSYLEYENRKNEELRVIVIPNRDTAIKIKRELSKVLNGN